MRVVYRKDNRKRTAPSFRRRLIIAGVLMLICAIGAAGYRWRTP